MSVFSGPNFPAFGLNPYSFRTRENTDQKHSEYGHFFAMLIIYAGPS